MNVAAILARFPRTLTKAEQVKQLRLKAQAEGLRYRAHMIEAEAHLIDANAGDECSRQEALSCEASALLAMALARKYVEQARAIEAQP